MIKTKVIDPEALQKMRTFLGGYELITICEGPSARIRENIEVILQAEFPSPINPPPGCHFHTRCS